MQNKTHYTKLTQDLPEEFIDQGQIIEKLNGYLAWHHFPIHLDDQGMCNGLSTVCAKYILENKLDEFKKILHLISEDIRPDSECDNALNHFAVEVVLTQSPPEFEKKFSQKTAMQCLTIDGERLSSSFDFTLSAQDESWTEIIENLDLKEDEPMLVNGADHCICVHKKLGKYIVYDPNYRDGFRYFDDEIELVKQLHQCFLKNPVSYKPEPGIPLLLGIKVLRHPSLKNPRIPPFPNPCNLYEKYLAPQQRIADIERRLNDTLLYASKDTNDNQAIEKLMTLGATEFKEAIFGAIMNNNLHATRLLLEKIIALHPSEIENCIRYALYSGYEEIVSILATMCKIDYEKSLDVENLSITVVRAILGGNHKILARLLLDARKLFCQKNNIPDNAENEKKLMMSWFSIFLEKGIIFNMLLKKIMQIVFAYL